MGKYIGSPWGTITGKVDGSVGGKWKGINWLRKLVIPCSKGSIAKHTSYLNGSLKSYSFSYPQFNLRHAVVNILGFMTRKFYSRLEPVWLDYMTKHPGLKMSPMNAFVKANIASFFASMPSKNLEYNAATNAPLLTALKVSKGDLEPVAAILTATYTTGTGATTFTWTVTCFENGLATDKVFWAVAKKPLINSTREPTLYLYGMADSAVTRTTGTATVTLPVGLAPADLVLYVFLKDLLTIGYSDSKALQITAP
jgi:hypothetical protein